MPTITASMLYDIVACPHRVTMDLFEDSAKRDQVSPFLQLLWERGLSHEKEVISRLQAPFLDLSDLTADEREERTSEGILDGVPLIYGGRIRSGDLLGDPDLLRREDGGYVPGDIKSGQGEEGPEDHRKPKVHYAVQLALYADILERNGRSAGRRGFIWDINGAEFIYDLALPKGKRGPALWSEYEACLEQARGITSGRVATRPGYRSSTCKHCVWYSTCLDRLQEQDDLTLIPDLGPSKRDVMISLFPSIRDFAEGDIARSFAGADKTIFPGIGVGTLIRLQRRAKLLVEGGRPYLRQAVALPPAHLEIFFDIEVDPMRNLCYLHGFIERRPGAGSETYDGLFAPEPTPDGEEQAFARAVRYLQERPHARVYYYSKYERTIWRALQEKYPDVCAKETIEEIFHPEHSVDLYYDVVLKATEWPTQDYSIKTLASYLGFTWRDPHPSGARCVEMFDRWVKTRDPDLKGQILEYNEDDCRATRVLLDGIRGLSVNEN